MSTHGSSSSPAHVSSAEATLKQLGSAGVGLSKLSGASAINKNRHSSARATPPSPGGSSSVTAAAAAAHGNGAGEEEDDASASVISKEHTIDFDEMYTQADSDEDETFDVVNPLFEHAAGSNNGRFRTATISPADIGVSAARIIRYVKNKSRTPHGRVVVKLIAANVYKGEVVGSQELRVRIGINGWSAVTERNSVTGAGTTAQKFKPEFSMLEVPYYKMDSSAENEADRALGLTDIAELQIEVNTFDNDNFVGAATLNNVDKTFGITPKRMKLDLELNTSPVGTIEFEISYHKSTFIDAMGLRGKWVLEYPQRLGNRLKLVAESVPDAVERLVASGLPGLSGGAASWLVVLVLCIPFVLATLLTNWSWAFRQWILVAPLTVYFYVSWPVFFGWAFGTIITVFALHGYPGALKVPALHVVPWIRNWHLYVRVTSDDAAFGNPPGFPLENFGECARVDVSGRVSFRHVLDTLTLQYKRCPLKKVPDFKLLAKFDIDYIEFEHVMVDMQMYEGRFNIHAYSRLLAEGQGRNFAWWNGYWKKGDPMPNELEIRIIRAKDLVKTYHRKPRSLKQKAVNVANAVGPFGRNAVVEAFNDQGDDSDEEGGKSVAGGGDPSSASSSGGKRASKRAPAETVTTTGDDDDDEEDDGAGSKEEEEAERVSATYLGGGPPQFNPHDHTVRQKSKQGHFDPYVVVRIRRDSQKTHTQTLTNCPMWNETLFFHADDAAAVVHVCVYNREIGGDIMLGQWLMTLKWMLGNPYYCWHEKGMEVTPDRWMRGWFPLMSSKFRGVGKCGKLEMAMQWRYVPESKLRRKVEFPPLTALAQLQENSGETRLRMGDMARVKYWLNHEPFLYDIRRVTVRDIKFYVQDLFRGYQGRAEKKGIERSQYVEIARLDYLTEFRPRHRGDLGVTTYKVVYHFFRNIAPKVLDSTSSQAHVGSAIGQILGGASVHMGESFGSSVRHLFRGEVDKVGPVATVGSTLKTVGKAADRAIQYLHRNITQNKEFETQFKVPVEASDEDFLIETPVLSGYLARYAVRLGDGQAATDVEMEKEVQRKGSFQKKYFELKGRTIFFRKNRVPASSSLYALTYKIPLSEVVGAIYFVERDELLLNQSPTLGCVTRLRLTANDAEGGEDTDEGGAGNPKLGDWVQVLKNAGVPCFVWKRTGGAVSA